MDSRGRRDRVQAGRLPESLSELSQYVFAQTSASPIGADPPTVALRAPSSWLLRFAEKEPFGSLLPRYGVEKGSGVRVEGRSSARAAALRGPSKHHAVVAVYQRAPDEAQAISLLGLRAI